MFLLCKVIFYKYTSLDIKHAAHTVVDWLCLCASITTQTQPQGIVDAAIIVEFTFARFFAFMCARSLFGCWMDMHKKEQAAAASGHI
jgi:hypothetical protein